VKYGKYGKYGIVPGGLNILTRRLFNFALEIFHYLSLRMKKNINVLDLGCGNGVHTRFLASEGCNVTATDISKVGIARTKEHLDKAGIDALLRVENISDLSFPENSFDLIICMGVFDCAGLNASKTSLDRVKKVLKRSGKALFIFSSDRDYRILGENTLGMHGYSYAEVKSMFSEGFTNVYIDRYITTYEGESYEKNDWLVTLEK